MNEEIVTRSSSEGTAVESGSLEQRFSRARQETQSLAVSVCSSIAIGAVLAAAVLSVEPGRALSLYWFAAAGLMIVVQQDLRNRRIPNWLVGSGILLALAHNTYLFGTTGLFAGLIGCFLPFVMLIVLYVGRTMGAGDIKALMALGALWGASVILQVIMWSLVIGGAMALVILLVHGELISMLRRWGRMLVMVLVQREFRYEPPSDAEAAAGGLPFGVAIGLGVAVAQLVRGGLI